MTYLYVCDMCGCEQDIVKPSYLAGREEYCEECKVLLRRIYEPCGLNFMTLTPAEKNDVTKYKLDTGQDLVCIGEDKAAVQKIQPKLSQYDLPSEITAKFEG